MLDHEQRGRVGPLEVVEPEQHRLRGGDLGQPAVEGVEQAVAVGVVTAGAVDRGVGHERVEVGEQVAERHPRPVWSVPSR